MKMYKRILSVFLLFSMLGLIILIPGRKWARGHVNYITAVEDHPLNCISCHAHNQKTGLISKLVNRQYLSPFNIVVSEDGSTIRIFFMVIGNYINIKYLNTPPGTNVL